MTRHFEKFQVREARALDRSRLLGLYHELQAYECTLHPNRADPDEVTEDHWNHLLSLVDVQQGKIWVAENSEGQLLGFILTLIETCEPYLVESDRQAGYVSDIAVTKKARGYGIGQALMNQAEQFFRQNGLAQMQVGVLCANQMAREFYQAGGFQPYEMVYEKRLDALKTPKVAL